MTQEIRPQSYHNQFDNRLANLLDSNSLSFLDELLKQAREELFKTGDLSEEKSP